MKNHHNTNSGRQTPVAGIPRVGEWSFWSYNKIAQLLKLICHAVCPFAFASFTALLKAIFIIGLSGLEHGVDQRQQFSSQCYRRPLGAFPLFDAPVPTGQIKRSFNGR